MRLLSVIALMGAFILGCENLSHRPITEGTGYPVVVGKGTYIQFEGLGGNCYQCVTLMYTGEDGLLHRQIFYVNTDNSSDAGDNDDAITIPEPLYQGNYIVITRTGDSAYAITKEE